MKYELSLLESMVTRNVDGEPGQEAVRIKEVFLGLALSHKKHNQLRRYFRVHREGLESLNRTPTTTFTKRRKQLLAITTELAAWMDNHLAQFLETDEVIDPDDPDIDARKLITTLNLSELGVLVRLYVDAGVLRVRNRKAMTRFMSRYIVVSTKKVPETFSEDHLYNAIHTPALPALDKVQRVLNEMLIQLNKLRREKRQKEKGKI